MSLQIVSASGYQEGERLAGLQAHRGEDAVYDGIAQSGWVHSLRGRGEASCARSPPWFMSMFWALAGADLLQRCESTSREVE